MILYNAKAHLTRHLCMVCVILCGFHIFIGIYSPPIRNVIVWFQYWTILMSISQSEWVWLPGYWLVFIQTEGPVLVSDLNLPLCGMIVAATISVQTTLNEPYLPEWTLTYIFWLCEIKQSGEVT